MAKLDFRNKQTKINFDSLQHFVSQYFYFYMETRHMNKICIFRLMFTEDSFIALANLHSLIVSLRDSNFASFCRILSVVIADIDFSEDRNTRKFLYIVFSHPFCMKQEDLA